MKKAAKRFLKLFFVLLFIVAAWNYNLVLYGIRQLKGQLTLIWNAEPVVRVLKDPMLKREYREKLLLTSEIREFAMDSLGLKNSKNYTTYYDQQEKPIMWVVTGCLPYELKAKEWWFPLLGNVSYKGFFSEELAIRESQIVQTQGYETDIYSPSAWSTLGFFKDPIFSNMLKRSPGRLAELIIHELTHATVYLESSVDYNENLATFIGEQGALQFLESKYGKQSEEYKRYQGYLSDEIIYGDYMMQNSRKLDSLYNSFPKNLVVKEKAFLKYTMIADIMAGTRHLLLSYPERYRFDFNKSRLPNNNEFMAFLRYRKKQDNFKKIYEGKYHSDLKTFIANIEKDPDLKPR